MYSAKIYALTDAARDLIINNSKKYPAPTLAQITRKATGGLNWINTSSVMTSSVATQVIKALEGGATATGSDDAEPLDVVPVCENYYTKYRGNPDPSSDAELRECLPVGKGNKMHGIRYVTIGDEVGQQLYEMWATLGVGRSTKLANRYFDAVEEAGKREGIAVGVATRAQEPAREFAAKVLAISPHHPQLHDRSRDAEATC